MNIKLKSLNITNYDELDKRKYRFVNEIKDDQLVMYFVSKEVDKYIKESERDNDLTIGNAYIITDGKKPVGFIRLARLTEAGILNLHYGVNPICRHQGYGSKILSEVGTYLLNNIPRVKNVELDIRDVNRNSIKCAEHAKYKLVRTINTDHNDDKVFVYMKGK